MVADPAQLRMCESQRPLLMNQTSPGRAIEQVYTVGIPYRLKKPPNALLTFCF